VIAPCLMHARGVGPVGFKFHFRVVDDGHLTRTNALTRQRNIFAACAPPPPPFNPGFTNFQNLRKVGRRFGGCRGGGWGLASPPLVLLRRPKPRAPCDSHLLHLSTRNAFRF